MLLIVCWHLGLQKALKNTFTFNVPVVFRMLLPSVNVLRTCSISDVPTFLQTLEHAMVCVKLDKLITVLKVVYTHTDIRTLPGDTYACMLCDSILCKLELNT
mmetsp:Transcript_3419/g.6554  ORF Transcript_3419/g.6554 Transcript_3419/m.6554 type:complete len:102 (-) Transcript_3419:63-368(-)